MLGLFSLSVANLPAASYGAEKFDNFWQFLLVAGTAVFVLVLGAAFYFVIKYRRKREGEPTPYIPHSFVVEFVSLFFTSVVVAIVFIWGWIDYKDFITSRIDETEINVVGQQWEWHMQYADGRNFKNELYVQRGRPVKLVMTSKDVIHSFFIPAFRIKQDTVPGLFTPLRFMPTKSGVYDIFCTEFCGAAHSAMLGKVYVLEPEEYQKWQNGTWHKPEAVVEKEIGENTGVQRLTMAEQGAVLYRTKACYTCHTTDGSRLVGPSFKALWGSQQEMMDGQKVMVDENYVRESVMDPMKKIVKGYPPSMPVFRGQLNDEEVNQIIAYLKTLK